MRTAAVLIIWNQAAWLEPQGTLSEPSSSLVVRTYLAVRRPVRPTCANASITTVQHNFPRRDAFLLQTRLNERRWTSEEDHEPGHLHLRACRDHTR